VDTIHRSTQDEKAETGGLRLNTSESSTTFESFSRALADRSGILMACALLLVLSVALFHRALVFVPADALDLRLLSSAASTSHPLKYLVGDWGEAPYLTGNYGLYRPLHPISLWIVYRIFGLRAFPNQLINFALHLMNAVLLLTIVWRIQRDLVLGFLGASLFLVSVHTMSPAIWVTDRPSLQVGLALLLLLHHLVSIRRAGETLRNWYVFLLCLLALLSKESGLIVPLIAIVESMRLAGPLSRRIRSGMLWVGVIGVYFLGRVLMFGRNAVSYSKGGYLFGFWQYERIVDLPEHLRKLALVDNAVKSVLEVFLPVFNNEGGFHVTSKATGLAIGLGVLAMVCLLALTMRRELMWLQIDCLWIILFNAAIHFEVFKFRVLYTAQIAICLFIACSPLLHDVRRKTAAVAAACLLLVVSTVRVDQYVQSEYLTRYNELNRYNLANVMQSYAGKTVKPEIFKQIIEKYQDHN
jgi:hypothetical protein